MMTPGQRLAAGQEIRANGMTLAYQGDGNLVLHDGQGRPRWATGTHGRAPGHVEMQADGFLVVYDAAGAPIWRSGDVAVPGGRLRFDTAGIRVVATVDVPTWQVVLDTPAEPEPPPVGPFTLTRLRVEDNRRWFANEAGRFDWREVSAFSLLSRLLAGEDQHVRDYLAGMRARGFTVVRVILTLDGDYWTRSPLGGRSFRCAPDMPGYWQALDRLVELTGAAGLYLRAVFLGAVEPFGGVWHPDRRDVWHGDVRARGEAFTVEAAQRIGRHAHVIGELANEPGQIGMRESFDELIALGRKVKAVAPDMLLGGGAVDGANDQDTRFAVSPFDYCDGHIERRMAVRGFEWVKRSGEYALIDQEHVGKKMPFISGEPVNFGERRADGRTGDVEPSPSVAFAYGAVSRARQYSTCFHYDGGLWTTLPAAETDACISSYMAALNAFPMLTDGKWRGHWAQSYWRQVWPPKDDEDIVERHVADGRGPWRVFGCGPYCVAFPEPDGWDYRANLTAPATRLAHESAGAFAAGVYRKD
ncbi:hypothetical protein [Luteitalea sp.]|uniref:hypothetical protein n=1 Tax=Luteitalea sp. TaxID=2004800 RepID=UPI0025BDB25F|nr:hypothetical protein [Luteitalea sp.]